MDSVGSTKVIRCDIHAPASNSYTPAASNQECLEEDPEQFEMGLPPVPVPVYTSTPCSNCLELTSKLRIMPRMRFRKNEQIKYAKFVSLLNMQIVRVQHKALVHACRQLCNDHCIAGNFRGRNFFANFASFANRL